MLALIERPHNIYSPGCCAGVGPWAPHRMRNLLWRVNIAGVVLYERVIICKWHFSGNKRTAHSVRPWPKTARCEGLATRADPSNLAKEDTASRKEAGKIFGCDRFLWIHLKMRAGRITRVSSSRTPPRILLAREST